jgi:hypothetical protein
MAETPEPVPAHADADPATLVFEALRTEVALVRRAVAGLSAERASIEIPHYSETLGQIMRASAATAQNLKALAVRPKTGDGKSLSLPKTLAVPTSRRSHMPNKS